MSLQNYSKVVLEVLEIARYVESALKDYLLPYESGLYLLAGDKPVIVPNKAYYYCEFSADGRSLVAQKALVSYEPLLQGKRLGDGYIFDQDGNLAYNQKNGPLYNTPQLPHHGLAMVKAYLQHYIDRRLQWVRYPLDLEDEIQKHLREDMREVSVAVLDIDEINRSQKNLNLISANDVSSFARTNYVMGDRVLVEHPKYGKVLAPIDLVEVRAANPICDWVCDFLSSELHQECVLLSEFVRNNEDNVYVASMDPRTLAFVVISHPLKNTTLQFTPLIPAHSQRERAPTLQELERLVGVSRRLPRGASIRQTDDPKLGISVFRRAADQARVAKSMPSVRPTVEEVLNDIDAKLGNQAHSG